VEQLREMLKEVLQEELTPIHGRLDNLDNRMAAMEGQMTSMEGRMTSMEGQMTSMEGRMTSMEGQMTHIKDQLDRMEQAQNEDIVSMLQEIDMKITKRTDRHEHQISVLNERLLTVEADVHKLLTT